MVCIFGNFDTNFTEQRDTLLPYRRPTTNTDDNSNTRQDGGSGARSSSCPRDHTAGCATAGYENYEQEVPPRRRSGYPFRPLVRELIGGLRIYCHSTPTATPRLFFGSSSGRISSRKIEAVVTKRNTIWSKSTGSDNNSSSNIINNSVMDVVYGPEQNRLMADVAHFWAHHNWDNDEINHTVQF